VDDAFQVLDPFDQIVVLGARAGDADGVRLLEGVGADQMGRDLAGQDHQGDGIHQGVDDRGDGVGRAGARRRQHHAGLAGGAGVALRRVARALLVARQHVTQARLMKEGVIDRQHRAARIAEQVGYPLIHQGADDDLGAREHFDRVFGGRSGGLLRLGGGVHGIGPAGESFGAKKKAR